MEYQFRLVCTMRYLLILCFVLIVTLFKCPEKPLEFTNPNDSLSDKHINSQIDVFQIHRIGLKKAEIKMHWDSIDEDVYEIHIYRYSFNNSDNAWKEDDFFQVPITSLIKDGSSDYVWNDTTLLFEHTYRYIFKSATNHSDESNKADTIDYFHGFCRPNEAVCDQLSDTSLRVKLPEYDDFADSIKYIWKSDSFITTLIDKANNIYHTLVCNDGSNDLSLNSIEIEYGVVIDGSTVWANVYQMNKTFEFNGITSLSAVRWSTSIFRIIWKYTGSPIVPNGFNVLVNGTTDTTISIDCQQNILDSVYYVYYGKESDKITCAIQPKTKYHVGEQSASIEICKLDSQYQDFYFVDIGYFSTGFYINLYETTNKVFVNWILQKSDSIKNIVRSELNFSETDFDRNFYCVPALVDKPVRGIPFDLAYQFAKNMNASLLTNDEWEIAARGSDNKSSRIYPWGDEYPSTDKVNYNNTLGNTLEVNSLQQGRVKINEYFNIYGAYHMAGNLMEWVDDSTSCYNLGKQAKKSSLSWRNCKGGSYDYPIEYLQISSGFCMPINSSSANVGFRLKKEKP